MVMHLVKNPSTALVPQKNLHKNAKEDGNEIKRADHARYIFMFR